MSDPNTSPGQPAPRPANPGDTPGMPDPGLAYEPPAPGPPRPVDAGSPRVSDYGPPPPPLQPMAAASGLVTVEDRNWAMAAHLSGFVAAYVALGFIGPLVVLLTAGKRSAFVRRHAVEALNFNLTVLIAVFVSAILVLVLIGLLMLLVLAVLYFAATIAGAVAASRGQEYRYPMTIRFVS